MEFSTCMFYLYILVLFYKKIVNVCFILKYLVSSYSQVIELHETACSRKLPIYKYLKGKLFKIGLQKERSWTFSSGINHHWYHWKLKIIENVISMKMWSICFALLLRQNHQELYHQQLSYAKQCSSKLL